MHEPSFRDRDTPSNIHHNIPGSRGGSDEDCNLSNVRVARHDDFHDWSGNRTPCYLTRLVALHAIGHDETSPDPETLNDLFAITTMRQWQRLYVAGALQPLNLPGAAERARKAAEYAVTHLTEERLAIREAIHALTNGGVLPSRKYALITDSLRFFQARDMRQALTAMYTEEHARELTWVKPIQETVRDAVLQTMKSPLRPFDAPTKRELVPVLRRQEGYVTRYLSEWAHHVPDRQPDDKGFRRPHRHRRGGR